MDETAKIFDDLVRMVIDGTATGEERRRMVELMRDDRELQTRYCLQMHVHALLKCCGGQVKVSGDDTQSVIGDESVAHRGAEITEKGGRQRAAQETFSRKGAKTRRGRWWKVAAAAILLMGTGVWRATDKGRSEKSEVRRENTRPSVPSPVTMVEWKGASGLEMPEELPGRIRLAKGEVKVRLPSGVELTLLGPLELEADERGMDVRLERGRLVAWVPPRASGFTARAPGLTAWDIGTVFSVAAETDGSSLFVFKGSVQVLDGAGGGVDICEAGEGVRAMADRTPFKVAAEGEAGERLFKAVRGYAAISDPQKALDAARQIGELWMAKYVPEEAERVREAARREAAVRNAPKKIPFTKRAWVRPSVPAQQEEESMKTTSAAALAAAAVMMGAGTAGAVSEPVWVNASPAENRCWETVYSNEVDVAWRWDAWPTNAVSAELLIDGMSGTALATNVTRSVSNILWRAFSQDVPTAEDAYDLTLTFYGSGDTVVGAQTSRLAVVKGAFGKTGVISTPEGTPWPKVTENAVIPYDAGWTAATDSATNSRLVIAKAGGVTQTNALADAAGYFGWKVKRSDWGYGTFNLALTFPDTEGEWDGTLVRVPEGMMISVR